MDHSLVLRHPFPRAAHSGASRHPDDAHLSAFNAAFSDLGLRFRWDHATLDALKEFGSELARITAYIERFHSHLHSAYEADFLARLIVEKKSQYYRDGAPANGA